MKLKMLSSFVHLKVFSQNGVNTELSLSLCVSELSTHNTLRYFVLLSTCTCMLQARAHKNGD